MATHISEVSRYLTFSAARKQLRPIELDQGQKHADWKKNQALHNIKRHFVKNGYTDEGWQGHQKVKK